MCCLQTKFLTRRRRATSSVTQQMSSESQESPTMGSKKKKPSKESSHKDGTKGGGGKGGKKTTKEKSKTVMKPEESQQNTGGRRSPQNYYQYGDRQQNIPLPPSPQPSAAFMAPPFAIGMQPQQNMPPFVGGGGSGGSPYYPQPPYQAHPQAALSLPQGTEYQMMLHHLVTTLQEDIRQLNYRVKRLEDLSMAAGANLGTSTLGGGAQQQQQQQQPPQQQQQPAQSSTPADNNKGMEVIVKMLQEIRSTQQLSPAPVAGKTGDATPPPPPPPRQPSPITNSKENIADGGGGEGGQQQQQPATEAVAKAPVGKANTENAKKKARTADLIVEVARMIKEEKKTQPPPPPPPPKALPPKESNSGNKKAAPPETFAAKVDRIRAKKKKWSTKDWKGGILIFHSFFSVSFFGRLFSKLCLLQCFLFLHAITSL